MIDLNLLNKANNGDIIATGLFDDSPQGYNWLVSADKKIKTWRDQRGT